MDKKFKIGDIVEALDEDVSGKVIEISGNSVSVLTSDGFAYTFPEKKLIPVLENPFPVNSEALFSATKEKERPFKRNKNKPQKQKKEKGGPDKEVDLHIHELTDSTNGMQDSDMLNFQLQKAKEKLDLAIKEKLQRVVFIHGVGEGVLRAELTSLFNRYDNLDYYDADFKKYGMGATEVRIYQNP